MSNNILLVTDIFGKCTALQPLLQDIVTAGARVTIVDPYQGREHSFTDETAAYQAYSSNCGHDAYATKAGQALQNATQAFDLAIGFSAGASALWRALAQSEARLVKQAVLFYPGQIHNHITLNPKIPVQVIFGHSEPHFAVADICTQLLQKPGVTAVSTTYAHGFMNPASKAFDSTGYQQCFTRFITFTPPPSRRL